LHFQIEAQLAIRQRGNKNVTKEAEMWSFTVPKAPTTKQAPALGPMDVAAGLAFLHQRLLPWLEELRKKDPEGIERSVLDWLKGKGSKQKLYKDERQGQR
jgi:hypothetical protein